MRPRPLYWPRFWSLARYHRDFEAGKINKKIGQNNFEYNFMDKFGDNLESFWGHFRGKFWYHIDFEAANINRKNIKLQA